MSIVIPGLLPQGSRLLLKPTTHSKKGCLNPLIKNPPENPPIGIVLSFGSNVRLNVDDCGMLRALKVGDRVVYTPESEINFYTNLSDPSSLHVIVSQENILLTLLPQEDLLF